MSVSNVVELRRVPGTAFRQPEKIFGVRVDGVENTMLSSDGSALWAFFRFENGESHWAKSSDRGRTWELSKYGQQRLSNGYVVFHERDSEE